MIAIALVSGPAVLIADEPTTALDVTVQAQILELLAELSRELQLSLLFITHDLGVVAQVADRVAVMYAGRVVEHGPVMEVLRAPRHPYTAGLLRAAPRLVRREMNSHPRLGAVTHRVAAGLFLCAALRGAHSGLRLGHAATSRGKHKSRRPGVFWSRERESRLRARRAATQRSRVEGICAGEIHQDRGSFWQLRGREPGHRSKRWRAWSPPTPTTARWISPAGREHWRCASPNTCAGFAAWTSRRRFWNARARRPRTKDCWIN